MSIPYECSSRSREGRSMTHELPVDLALGKVDYIEVMGFSGS